MAHGIMIQVYQKDVFDDLVRKEVNEPTDFDWLHQVIVLGLASISVGRSMPFMHGHCLSALTDHLLFTNCLKTCALGELLQCD